MKLNLSIFLLISVFLTGTFAFIGARDGSFQNGNLNPDTLQATSISQVDKVLKPCGLPTCLRISSRELSRQVTELFVDISSGLALYDPSHFGGEGKMSFDIRPSILLSGILVRVILLLPIIAVAILLFQSVWSKLSFLVLTFLALVGWGPWLYVSWYRFITQFVDWPIAWWDFRQPVHIYDYGSIGYVFLLSIYLCTRKRIKVWEIVALTVLGQSIFEHLGLVTGISMFIFEVLRDETTNYTKRLKRATYYLSVCGLASLLFFVGLYSTLNSETTEVRTISITEVFFDYLHSFWSEYGTANFDAIHILGANFFTLLFPPVIAGSLLAGIMKFTENPDKVCSQKLRLIRNAGLAVVIGFSCAIFVGMFVSGYHSEAGRQLIPLISILLFASTFQWYWFLIRKSERS